MKTAALAFVGLMAMTTLAFAHGDAMWIQLGGYATAGGDPCCGPTDCAMEMTGDVVPDGDGWKVLSTGQRFARYQREVFPSIDRHFWTCRKYPARLGAKAGMKFVHCLFVPVES